METAHFIFTPIQSKVINFRPYFEPNFIEYFPKVPDWSGAHGRDTGSAWQCLLGTFREKTISQMGVHGQKLITIDCFLSPKQ